MLDPATIQVGDKVHFIGFEGQKPENGMVKEIPETMTKYVRVVYKCAGDWENFKNYTSALTDVRSLHKGWVH